ncbi:hypothetical protein BKA69DRAFT_198364 [Paraphysoderma sedebokerense]|nr:hypothetical protein BKA69DRAFT_198364 [Paraphysoderma sedebokerense]
MLSADQNFPVAQYNLAQQFLRGEGIKSDSFRAFGLFSKSATTFDLSMYYLGSLYYLGYGVCQNNKKALEWWVRAAEEKNCLVAKKTLLWYYSNDAKNKAEALKWKDRVESHVRRSGEDIRFGVNITTGIESNGMLKNQVR